MINHNFNKYGFKEQSSFSGLIPKLMEKLGEDCCEGYSDVNVSIFDPTANGNDSMKDICPQDVMMVEVGPTPDPEPEPEPEPEPKPAEEESDAYDYVFDEDSWNESEANGALKKYHEKYPEEDWWNNAADRACNYNDRLYKGTLDSEEVESLVEWASGDAQKLTINGDVYYGPIFYGFVPQDVELFNDIDLTESAGKVLLISEITYNGDCSRCWKGAINNPGAQYPWVCPNFEDDVDAKVVFRYEGAEDEMPWGDKVFHAGDWGCESVAKVYGDDFDIDKFKMILKRD